MTIYHITSNIKKIVQQLMFMIKCLNGFVIKWTDKINYMVILLIMVMMIVLVNTVVFMVWLTSLIVIYGFIQSDMLCMLFRPWFYASQLLAFKLIWFSFWGILSCKMLWCINTISVCQTDTVSYVKMMYFTSILKVIPPFCYFDLCY